MDYLDEVASMASLRAALDRAVRRRGGPGPDGVTLLQFASATDHELGRLRDGKSVAAIPVEDISHVALHGPITMTGAAIARVLDAGVDVTLHTSAGRLRGMMTSAQPKNVFLLLAQAEAWRTPERRLAFAKVVVASKLRGQRQFLQRHALDRGSQACATVVEQIDALARRIEEHDGLDAVRGIEGAAAAAYFTAFRDVVGPAWGFTTRARRPPPDPVNALLSFGYTLAGAELGRHLLRAGFDTRIGLFHGVRYGRESLPLDLVDELRTPMVDRFTVSLLHRRQLAAEDFEPSDNGGVRLKDEARRRYLELWEEMLNQRAPNLRGESPADPNLPASLYVHREATAVPADPPAATWRQRMQRQVAGLYAFLMHGKPYQGILSSQPAEK